MNPQIKIAQGDVADVPCDILLLKHADGFHGADAYLAGRIGFEGSLEQGEWQTWPGRGLSAKLVLFGGVGPLETFRYEAIRAFARRALNEIGKNYPDARTLACTMHGPGYGLDEKESFHALLAGLLDGAASAPNLREIQIAELDPRRVQRLQLLLDGALEVISTTAPPRKSAEIVRPNFSSVGRESERKPRLFVAMPFRDEFADEFEIAFMEASDSNGFLCERADLSAFTGDILDWVRNRIETCSAMIALMNTANPNVFLEIGYAWAKGVPTILIVKKGEAPPFNVNGQRFIEYQRIGDLRRKLTAEIASLKEQGVLSA